MAVTADQTWAAAPAVVPAPDGVGAPAPWQGLAATAERAGVPLDGEQLDRFAAYRRLLLAWNARTNLTAVRDPVAIDRRLVLDALLLVPTIDALLSQIEREPPRLVDVGSGAGFPGLALKIARPGLEVTLVEATGKKVAFLAHVIAELGLVGAVAVHARAEDLGRDRAYRAAFDLATARAVASLPSLLELCAPLLRVGGHGLFPKGLAIAEELAAGARAAPALRVRILAADRLPASETRLVVVEKTAPTPDRYPRRAGIPAREPLGAEPRARRPAHPALDPAATDRRPPALVSRHPAPGAQSSVLSVRRVR